ncbi:NPCBM/NEW2 domain-containing protein [Actinosynnema sp. CA-248983]
MATGRLVGLFAAGAAVLVVGILLGTQLVPEPTPVASSVEAPSTQATTTTTTHDPDPNAFWLADRKPTGSTSVDDHYNAGPWTSGPANIRGNTRDKAWSATGAWCGTAQLHFTVDNQFGRITAQVAIAGNSAVTKPLDFFILADGNRVAEYQTVGKAPQPVDVSIAGAQTITIGTEPPDGDVTRCPGPERIAVWAEARLIPGR